MTDDKIRILIVDDEPDVCTVLQSFLEPEFEALSAKNGLDALHKLPRYEPDLLIIDLMMPYMDGWELARRVRDLPDFFKTPLVFLSALDSKESIRKGYETGACVYITKPFDPKRVVRNLRVSIERDKLKPRPKQYAIQVLRKQEAEEVRAPFAPPDSSPLPTLPPIERSNKTAPPETAPAPEASPSAEPSPPSPPAPQPEPTTTSGVAAIPPESPSASPRTAPTLRSKPSTPAQPERKPASPELWVSHEPSPAPGQFPTPPRILLVDDDVEVLEILRLGLEQGFEVVTARDGLDALNKIPDVEPDLYIIDIMLPKMSGLQLLQLLRQNADTRRAPILILTAKSSNRDREYAKSLGASAYITKPFLPHEVIAELKQLTRQDEFSVKHPKRKDIAQILLDYATEEEPDEQGEPERRFRKTERLVSDFLYRHGDEGPFGGKHLQG